MNPKLLTKCLQELAIGLGVELPEERIEFYLKALHEIPEAPMRMALERAAKECKFFPTPVELIELSGFVETEAQARHQAIQWWNKMRTWRKNFKHMPLPDNILAIVRQMGGRGDLPTSFGKWPDQEDRFKKQEFIGHYLAHQFKNVDDIHGRIVDERTTTDSNANTCAVREM